VVFPFFDLSRVGCFQCNCTSYSLQVQRSGWYIRSFRPERAKADNAKECLRDGGEFVPERNTDNEQGKFKQVLKIPVVNYLAFFVLIYVRVEVTIGGKFLPFYHFRKNLRYTLGWIVTFIVSERYGGPSSGYISSGFFGGLMLGRIVLLWVKKFIGEWRVIFLYSFLAIGYVHRAVKQIATDEEPS